MPKVKSVFICFVAFITMLAGIYIYSVVTLRPFMGGVLSPAAAAVTGFVFLYLFLISDRKNYASRALRLFSVGSFCWMLSDILWIIRINLGIDPSGEIPVLLGYITANIVIGAGALYIGFSRFSKWMLIRNLVEALSVGIIGTLFIWTVLFDRGDTAAEFLTTVGLVSSMGTFFGLFIIIELGILIFSGLGKRIPFHTWLTRAGLASFFTADLYYFYCKYHSLYYTGSAVDVVYILSLMLIAFGTLLKAMSKNRPEDLSGSDDICGSRWYCLLAFPIIATAAKGVFIIDLLIYAGVIALSHASIKYIGMAKENERLLENEISINANLAKQIGEQVRELAVLDNQDTLTNLYNRRYFFVLLDEAVRSLKEDETLAVIQFDVDRFKTVNDSYGHDVGDKVIIEISHRLTSWNKCGAVLGRLGGDEFVILLRGGISRHVMAECCRQIIGVCGAPIHVGRQSLYLTISIGISSCPRDAADVVSLMRYADMAMYRAKAEGYNKYVFYSPAFKKSISRKNKIEALLRNADLQAEFELVYQPQFALPDKKLIGAEALIRWKSAEHGYIPPSVFIPVAEEINYISRIGKWVLTKAVEQIIKWNTEYSLHLKMGINISPKQLSEDDFFMTLKTLITANQFNTSWIDAEITENLMIEEKSRVKPIFDLFKELNISVSIDDFGSGYSSLGYLNKYHFDRIKIDKSLVDGLTAPGGSGVEVVKAIISMSNAVGKTVIAEGVETAEQLRLLTELGCRQVQGYLLGKPISAEEFEKRFITDLANAV